MLFSDRERFTRWLKAFTELAVSSVAALSLSNFLHYSGIIFHLYTLLMSWVLQYFTTLTSETSAFFIIFLIIFFAFRVMNTICVGAQRKKNAQICLFLRSGTKLVEWQALLSVVSPPLTHQCHTLFKSCYLCRMHLHGGLPSPHALPNMQGGGAKKGTTCMYMKFSLPLRKSHVYSIA